jgi:hypothetical protein
MLISKSPGCRGRMRSIEDAQLDDDDDDDEDDTP